MDDCRAVLDAAGSTAGGGPHRRRLRPTSRSSSPRRIPSASHALVLWQRPLPRNVGAGLPVGAAARGAAARDRRARAHAGPPRCSASSSTAAPSLDAAERQVFARVIRLSVSPGAAAAFERMTLDVDVRGVLPSVRVPTLVMHRADEPAEDGEPAGSPRCFRRASSSRSTAPTASRPSATRRRSSTSFGASSPGR